MTTTIITTNTIGAGTQFAFVAAGDNLVVLPNVTLGSTTGSAIAFGGLTDLEVTILGTLVGPGSLTLNANSGFTIAAGGTVVSQQSGSTSAALVLGGGTSQASVDGTLLATEAIGILAVNGANIIAVTGSLTGGSGGVFQGLFGGSGDMLVNSGTIRCGAYDDAINGTRRCHYFITNGRTVWAHD